MVWLRPLNEFFRLHFSLKLYQVGAGVDGGLNAAL